MDYPNKILNSAGNLVIFSLDKEYKYTFFNKNHASVMKSIWGLDIQLGVPMFDFITKEDDRKKAKRNFDRALNGEDFSEIEEYGDENIDRRHYEDFYSPLKDDDEQIIGLTVFVSDVSKQIKNQKLLESINQNIAEGIYRSDEDALVYVNKAFVKMFGYTSQEEVRALDSSRLYKDTRQRDRLIELIKSDGFFVNEEVTFVKKSSEEFTALVSTISYTDPSGHTFMDGAIRDVTMEREASRKANEKEQLLQSINHNINEAIYRSENKKGLIYVNEAFVRMFGYESAEEILKSDALDLYLNSEDRTMLGDDLVKKGAYSNREVQFKRKNGLSFWGSLSSIMIKNEDGSTYFDGAISDISERKENEFKLLESRALLESINENISEGIYRSNESRLIYINKAFVDLFGYQSEIEVLKQNAPDFYKDSSQRVKLMNLLNDFGSFENKEVTFLKKNGEEFTGLVSSTRYKDGQGNTFWDGAIRDISHQKESEKQITLQNRMQEMLTSISMKYINIPLEEIDDAIDNSLQELGTFANADRAYVFDFDSDKRICSNTHEWCRNGIKTVIEKCQNTPFDSLPYLIELHEDGQPFIMDNISEQDHIEYKNLLVDQDIKSLVTVPCMEGTKCVGFVGFDYVLELRKIGPNEIILLGLFAQMLVNVRIRTHDQNERQKLLETTTNQNNRLKDFSYITSHNIRSSVANFIGLLDIQRNDPANQAVAGMLQTTADKLNDTIKNINELLNFENDIESLSLIECNLRESLQHVIDLNDKTIKEEGIDVSLDAADHITICGIPAYLDSIFHNFMTNAIKYGTTEGSKKINITVTPEGKGYLVSFQDSGLGIDMKKYGEKLFNLGTRFHADHKDGQGLGLFMVKRHIDAMNGRIEVESEPNKGTTFKVWFHGK